MEADNLKPTVGLLKLNIQYNQIKKIDKAVILNTSNNTI
jgi:hypothetical protein